MLQGSLRTISAGTTLLGHMVHTSIPLPCSINEAIAGDDHAEQNPTIMEPNDTAKDAKTAFLVIFGRLSFGPGWFKSM